MRKAILTGLAMLTFALPLGNWLGSRGTACANERPAAKAAYDSLYYVWYRRSLDERWHGLGPYNFYDASSLVQQLRNQGFAAYWQLAAE
jgi:hypothetical protein